MYSIKFSSSLWIPFLLSFLSACSGGGGTPSPPLDTQPPTITYTTPDNGSTGIAQHPTLYVTFSEEMDPATINGTTFILKDSSNNPVTGTVNYDSFVATFTPTTNLDYSMTYIATVSTGVADLAGNNMAAEYVWSFTTVTAPQISATNPTQAQDGVLVSTAITVTFNRAMDPASINATTFTLMDAGSNPVTGSITASGSSATFTPTNLLSYSTTYTATVSSAVSDASGNTLIADYIWDFSTINVLGNAVNIESSSDNVSCPHTAFDSSGNAYVVWNQGPDYTSDSVWANRYTSTAGWEVATAIESSPDDIWGCPSVDSDGSGNIVVVWSQSGLIMLNRYVSGSGWSTPETVGGTTGLTPSVAVDPNGNIFVVWEDSRSIWARRYETSVGWGTATLIESYTPEAYNPSVMVDHNGNATVVWAQQVSSLLFSATANHYTVGSGWGVPVTISTDLEGILNNLVIADIDASGNVFAAWSQGTVDTTFTIRGTRYVPGSGWDAPTSLDSDLTTTSSTPSIAASSGGAAVTWGKYDHTIYAATYSAGSGWSSASAVAIGAVYPAVAINSSGKISVAWNHEFQHGDTWEYGTRIIQYAPATGWGNIQLLAPNNFRSWNVDLITDDTGNFLAAWSEGPGPTADKIMSNLFQ